MKLLKYLGVAALALPSLQAEVLYTNDFESDSVGGEPSAFAKLTPSSSTAVNGHIVIDSSSTPANPLTGQSLYVYDAGWTDGLSTQASFLFNEDATDMTDLRIDFDFHTGEYTRDDTTTKELTDDGIDIGITRGAFIGGVNSSANRPFDIRLYVDGRLVIKGANTTEDGETFGSPEVIGNFSTDSAHSLTILINSHDTDGVDYDFADLDTDGTVAANSADIFLDGAYAGTVQFFSVYPGKSVSPLFDASNADLGCMGFFQDTNSQGAVVVDNISVETLFDSPVPVINAVTEDFVIVEGDSATLEVDASGAEPLSYQWYEGESGDVSSPVEGATSAVAVIPNVTEASQFWVRVTNENDSADSDTVNITMYQAQETLVSSETELNSTLASAKPGDVIIMENGDWTDTQIVISADGTELNNITLRAEESGQVFLKGNSTLNIGGDYVTVEGLTFYGDYTGSDDQVIEFRNGSSNLANYSRLTDCAMVDYNGGSSLYVSDDDRIVWVNLYGTNNRVDHCYFSGLNEKKGLVLIAWITGEHFHTVDYNHFANRPEGETSNGHETIRLGTSDSSMYDAQITVAHNLFEECNGEIEIISNKSNKNEYLYNTFYMSEGALTMRHGEDCLIEGNIFIGDNTLQGGVRIIDSEHTVVNNYFYQISDRHDGVISVEAGISEDQNPPLNSYFPADNVTVAYNTFVDCDAPAIDMARDLGNSYDTTYTRNAIPENTTIADNIFYTSSTSTSSFVTGTDDETNVWAANIVYGRQPGIIPAETYTSVDPELSYDEDAMIYRPDVGSPVIDAAQGEMPAMDMDGQLRSGLADIGADEVTDTEGKEIFGQLTAALTGPSWLGEDRYFATPMPDDFFTEGSVTADDGNGNLTVDWLGDIYTYYFPWIYHRTNGWWYAEKESEGGYFFFDDDLGTWLYTHETYYPWAYDSVVSRNQLNWIYIYNGEDADVDDRVYWSDDDQGWFHID